MESKAQLYICNLVLNETYNDPGKWTPEIVNIIESHGAYLHELGKKGVLICAGRTQYSPGHPDLFGLVVFYADSIEEANQIMKDDPAIVMKIQMASIHPFSMGIRYFDNLGINN